MQWFLADHEVEKKKIPTDDCLDNDLVKKIFGSVIATKSTVENKKVTILMDSIQRKNVHFSRTFRHFFEIILREF